MCTDAVQEGARETGQILLLNILQQLVARMNEDTFILCCLE